MSNPFLERVAKKGQIGHGALSEKRVGLSLAARMQPASGAMASAKSDFKIKIGTKKFRGESKSTVKTTMPLDLAWLEKISQESASDGSIPILTLSFVTPEGKPRTKTNADWACIPMVFLKELLDNTKRREHLT
jgi:hypothetical protein